MTYSHLQNFDEIYTKLNNLGFPKNFIKNKVLPPYWDDKDNSDDSLLQGASIIARHLNLDIETLLNKRKNVKFNNISGVKYKLIKSHKELDIIHARSIAYSVAKHINYACQNELKSLPENGREIRDYILSKKKNSFVSFFNLIDYCWGIGIPVIFIDSFPSNIKKMQGMSVFVQERPAIVLTKNKNKSAWYLFTLAHELAHIIKNHVNSSNTVIVDEQVEFRSNDNEEIEANEIAKEIITGSPHTAYGSSTSSYYGLNGKILAEIANELSVKENVDPGFIALNFAWNTSSEEFQTYGIAGNALKIIEKDDVDFSFINKKVFQNIDETVLPEESLTYIKQILF